MRRQGVLFLRIGALASSLILLAGVVAYRSGATPPQLSLESVTPDQSIVSLNLNSIGPAGNESPVQPAPAAGGQSGLLGVKFEDVEIATDASSSRGVDTDGHVGQATTFLGSTVLLQEAHNDESGLHPGSVSEAQIRRDALTVMSSSKSFVLVPSQPADTQKAVTQFKQRAAHFFSRNDRNSDGKLTQGELSDHIWKKLVKRHAVENGAVSSDGILKNYVWLSQEK